jgi:hypothetical protein
VTDRETTLLSERLHRLADDMTPQLDVVGQVRTARARHKRRRMRLAFLAVATATAATAVAVPLTTGVLSSAPSGEVAGPGRPTTEAPTGGEDRDEDGARVDQRITQLEVEEATRANLAPGVERLSATFRALRTPISLSAPSSPSCGLGLEGALSGTADACAMPQFPSPPATEVRGTIRFRAGESVDDLRQDVNRESGGCYPAAMPNPGPMAVLVACQTPDGSEWTLRILAADDSGVWELRAEAVEAPEDRASTAGPSMLISLMETANAEW